MAIVYKTVGCLLLLAILGLYHGAHAATTAKVSWYVQGDAVTTNATVNLNTGDTFTFLCKAAGGDQASVAAGAGGAQTGKAKLFISKSAPATAITRTVSTDGVPTKVTTTTGSFVYNTYEGTVKGYDHWQVSVTIVDKRVSADFPPFALAQINIPRVSSVDMGTYYCSFFDATGVTGTTFDADKIASSTGLTLQIATRSSGRNLATSKMLDYSFALLTAYKIMY